MEPFNITPSRVRFLGCIKRFVESWGEGQDTGRTNIVHANPGDYHYHQDFVHHPPYHGSLYTDCTSRRTMGLGWDVPFLWYVRRARRKRFAADFTFSRILDACEKHRRTPCEQNPKQVHRMTTRISYCTRVHIKRIYIRTHRRSAHGLPRGVGVYALCILQRISFNVFQGWRSRESETVPGWKYTFGFIREKYDGGVITLL